MGSSVLIVFALAAAVLYGSADFLGGTASRRSSALPVAATSTPAGAVVMLVAVLVARGPATPDGLLWAALGGGIGGGGLIVFYGGLAAGPMSVVAPVAALVSTVVPVGVAVAGGERPGLGVYAGVLVCLAAIGLVSQPGGQQVRRSSMGPHPALRGLAYGSVSGFAFGLFFVFLNYAGRGGVFWPVFTARLAGTSVVLAAAVIAGTRPVWRNAGSRVVYAAAGSGLLDACANVAYVLATRAGLFGIAVILTSLYPGITVLLARVVHGERMHLVQRVGLLLAAAGVALVTG